MNVVSIPSPACTSAVTSNSTTVPSAMLFVMNDSDGRAGPWTPSPPFHAGPTQSWDWLEMSESILQFHVTPAPVPCGLLGIGKLFPLPSGGVFVGGSPLPQSSKPGSRRKAEMRELSGQFWLGSGQK